MASWPELGTYDLAPRWVMVFQAADCHPLMNNPLAPEQLMFGSAVAVMVDDGEGMGWWGRGRRRRGIRHWAASRSAILS